MPSEWHWPYGYRVRAMARGEITVRLDPFPSPLQPVVEAPDRRLPLPGTRTSSFWPVPGLAGLCQSR
ncbi:MULTISPECIES: hypothetical protein [Amycolatopsis]|uniref:hypothetical protein n=1 Tax=Amycolatopsis TaxID=1813 RepID=UPI001E438676|nr:hypothetical protein [Amycolatopsis sp. M39]